MILLEQLRGLLEHSSVILEEVSGLLEERERILEVRRNNSVLEQELTEIDVPKSLALILLEQMNSLLEQNGAILED
ncbi:hypothetical protein MKY27_02510 [Solibacillus sp. FSL R5-0449]|uniref:hypothetical protein n=1 Tax=Solibacillus sp. FSL R5-0449 TaxID=2921639 RepID=UPI0030D22310